VVERLSQKPHEAFGAILGFRGPYPKKIHPIDVHEAYLAPLLASLPRPFILIAAAIEANDPRFADTMLASLKDRSIDVKMAVVHAIRQCSFLHTPQVRQQMATKSI